MISQTPARGLPKAAHPAGMLLRYTYQSHNPRKDIETHGGQWFLAQNLLGFKGSPLTLLDKFLYVCAFCLRDTYQSLRGVCDPPKMLRILVQSTHLQYRDGDVRPSGLSKVP